VSEIAESNFAEQRINSSFSRFVENISSSGEGLSVFPTTFAKKFASLLTLGHRCEHHGPRLIAALHPNSNIEEMTDITFIIIGALATAFLLLVVLLILGLLYYRWRLSDSQHMLVRFIRENFRLHEKLNENGIY
jgi:hypothetical protein